MGCFFIRAINRGKGGTIIRGEIVLHVTLVINTNCSYSQKSVLWIIVSSLEFTAAVSGSGSLLPANDNTMVVNARERIYKSKNLPVNFFVMHPSDYLYIHKTLETQSW